MVIDEVSKKILRIIQIDSDVTLSDLADKVGVSTSPVWQRLMQMRAAGIIKRNVAILDPAAVGMDVKVLCFIKLDNHKEEKIREFTEGSKAIDEVLQCFSIAGESDFLVIAVASSISNYDTVVKPKILNLPNVDSLNTNFVLSQIKNTMYLPVH